MFISHLNHSLHAPHPHPQLLVLLGVLLEDLQGVTREGKSELLPQELGDSYSTFVCTHSLYTEAL